ncbi:uromodulin-like 1 isoform X2 [Sebastes fasciatus]|uniref:uromodulin-like 1 isoform X2 n=1 Tax=Sebastes fasciatus TaxID=394691 RepID=UPI003D9E5C00
MSWMLSIWVATALLALCRGQNTVHEGNSLSASGYHLCIHNETRNVSFLVMHTIPYTETKRCGGWLHWKKCTVALYKMTLQTEYKTTMEQVTRCCSGYVQVGRYCARPANRSVEFTAKPGSCPTADGLCPRSGDCEWDMDCPGWQKCCQRSGRFVCIDPAISANYSENGGCRLNATVTVKTDYQQLMSSDGGHLDHIRLLKAMVTGALQSDVSVYYLGSQPVHPYRTATSLLIVSNCPLSLYNVTSKLHLLLKHIQEVSSVSVEDVDECAQPALRQCSHHADCNNTVGSYHCACHQGYTDVDPSNPGAHCTASISTQHPLDIFNSTETSMTTALSNTSPVPYNSSHAPRWTSSAPYSSMSSSVEPSLPTTTCSPPSITSVWSANVTGTSFCVYWSSPFQTNQTYQVVVRNRSEVTSQTMMEVRELKPGVLYNVTVTPSSCGSQGAALHILVKTDALTLDATTRLTNINFTAELQNTSSQAYKNLTESIEKEIYQSLSPEMKAMMDSGQVRIEIRSFSLGSVVVNFTIILAPSQSQGISNVSTALLHSLMNSTEYTVDENNTSTNDFNECDSGENDCSSWANCTNTWASYTCDCLDGFIDNNPERPGRACQAITTTTTAPTIPITAPVITSPALTTTTTAPVITTTAPTIITAASTTTTTAPTTTTTASTTTTTAPTTTTTASTTTTTAPTTTTTASTTTTTAPTTTTTASTTTTTAPTITSTAPTTTTTALTTTTTASTTTTTAPTTTTTASTTTTTAPTITSTAPTTTTTAPTTITTAPKTTTTAPKTNTTAPTTTTTASTTTTTAPTTTTTASTTTTTAPTITSTAPTTTTTAPTTTTTAPKTTTTAPKTNTTAPTTNTTAPTTITTAFSTTTTAPVITPTAPTNTTTVPTNTTTVPTITTTVPTNSTTTPTTTITSPTTTNTAPTTTTTAPKTNTTAPTTNTTAPTTITTAPITTTTAFATTTTAFATTTTAPVITPTAPTNTTTVPTNTTTVPTISTTVPTNSTITPTTTITSPTTTNTVPTTTAPTTTTATPTITTNGPTTIITSLAITTTTPTTTITAPTTTTATPTTTTSPTTTTTAMTSMTSTPTTSVTSRTTNITVPTTTATAQRTITNASGAISVQCRVAAITVTVAKDFLLSNKIRESTLYLGLPECVVNGDNDTHIQMTVAWDECGTNLVQNDTHYTASVTLFNNMEMYTSANGTVEVPRIQLKAPVMCTFMKSMLISADFSPMGYDMIKDFIMGSGSFQVTVQLMNGTMPLPHNYSLSSDEAVVVEVSLNTSSEQINVVINKCWATPTQNPADIQTSSDTFLDNSCPLNTYTQVLMNGNSSTSRLSVQIFSFVNLDVIYLHCRVQICVQIGSDTCVPDCLQRTARSTKTIGSAFGSSGALILKKDEESLEEDLNLLHIVGFSCLGIGLSLFFIIGFVCLFYYQRNRIGHYNFSAKPKQENFTYLVFNT